MRILKVIIISLFILTSCVNQQKSKDEVASAYKVTSLEEISIPDIEKNINNSSFDLINGVLFFDGIPYAGIVNEFYQDGSIKTQSEYFDGKRQGYFRGWYMSGNKWFDRYYHKGVKVDKHVGWFDVSGSLKFEYYFNDQGGYEGSVKEWYSNGKLAKHFNFKNGVEAGSQKLWKPNGNIKANFFTVEGERHGLIGLKNCVSVMSDSIK